jgi:hypothetical protein
MSQPDKKALAQARLYESFRALAAYAKSGDSPIESSGLTTRVDDLGTAMDEYVPAVAKSKSQAAG